MRVMDSAEVKLSAEEEQLKPEIPDNDDASRRVSLTSPKYAWTLGFELENGDPLHG